MAFRGGSWSWQCLCKWLWSWLGLWVARHNEVTVYLLLAPHPHMCGASGVYSATWEPQQGLQCSMGTPTGVTMLHGNLNSIKKYRAHWFGYLDQLVNWVKDDFVHIFSLDSLQNWFYFHRVRRTVARIFSRWRISLFNWFVLSTWTPTSNCKFKRIRFLLFWKNRKLSTKHEGSLRLQDGIWLSNSWWLWFVCWQHMQDERLQ